MLKRAFALSDQGAKDLAKGIIATACANLIQIIPASLLLMVVMMLLEKAAGTQVNVGRNIPFFVGITLVLFGMIAIAQLVQYNLTYTAAYKESANRRIVLAEKLRKLPLSFFEKKNLADLTTTIMGDCTALERTFSNAIPQLLGTILMFVIMSVGLAVLDWRMALCIIVPVPVASIVVVLARKAQSKAELENLEAKRCAYDAVQEYIDTIKELKAYSKTDVYLDELDKKLENVIRCSFRNELAPGASTTAAQFILRFGLVAVLLIGGNLVIEGMLSIPMLILFLLFAGRIYDTNIGENGSKLSGGERQRISIARALLKNAPVILLDEATASMDAESETMVQTALSALLKGRTVIVIAHRMRTIANADKIVVLDKGKVTEVGTPSELAKKGGLYAHLVALQQKQQMSSLPT